MAKQITVRELLALCRKEVSNGNGDKKIIISDDTEGNGFHGLYYGFLSTEDIYGASDFINDVHETDDGNIGNMIILG